MSPILEQFLDPEETRILEQLKRDTPALRARDQGKYEWLERIIAGALAERTGAAPSDLRTRLDAIEFDRMAKATVGNMVATLKRVGRNHLLVVQVPTRSTPLRVRGVVSRAQIERQLGQAIDIAEIAGNFSEVERALL